MKLLWFLIFVVANQKCTSFKIQNDSKMFQPPDSRIIGGQLAYPAQYPFMAAINVQTVSSRLFCVGALIHNQWILTAGHCVYGGTLFTIQLGSNTLSGTDPNRVSVATSSWVVHPEYNVDTLDNDIGLIKLRLPLTQTEYIRVSDFLPTTPILDYQVVVAIGWGQLSDANTSLSNELRWVQLSTISNAECQLVYGDQITDTRVCASGNFNEGPCLGDSGGPLVRLLNGGRFEVVAVSSFLSFAGCESTDPSGYVRIFPYVDWIQERLNEE